MRYRSSRNQKKHKLRSAAQILLGLAIMVLMMKVASAQNNLFANTGENQVEELSPK